MINQQKEPYFKYLDELRESGAVNMFGAAPHLQNAFPELTRQEAREVWADWANNFAERHKENT